MSSAEIRVYQYRESFTRHSVSSFCQCLCIESLKPHQEYFLSTADCGPVSLTPPALNTRTYFWEEIWGRENRKTSSRLECMSYILRGLVSMYCTTWSLRHLQMWLQYTQHSPITYIHLSDNEDYLRLYNGNIRTGPGTWFSIRSRALHAWGFGFNLCVITHITKLTAEL